MCYILFTACFGQVHSVHPPPWQAGAPPAGQDTPPGTSPRQVHLPQDQVHPLGPGTSPAPSLGRYTLSGRYTPQNRYNPRAGTPREQCMLGDTGNKRAIRILLECILVFILGSCFAPTSVRMLVWRDVIYLVTSVLP